MIIRKMNISDYDDVDRLMQKLHKIHVNARPDLYVDIEHVYSFEKYSELVNDDKIISLLAEENNKAVGICFVTMRDRSMMVNMPTAYMEDLFVDLKYRHKGIAKALFKEAEEEAKRKGAKRIDLMVWAFNKEAMEFYKAMDMMPQRYILEKNL